MPVSRKLRQFILQRDQWTCEECSVKLPEGPWLHIDHRVPKSKGGSDGPENLRVLCQPCNSDKAANPGISVKRKFEIDHAHIPQPAPLFAEITIEFERDPEPEPPKKPWWRFGN